MGRDFARRLSFTSAALGALVWSATPWLPVGTPPRFGSLEHVFLSLPLVAAPLALFLRGLLLADRSPPWLLLRIALCAQPVAGALVLASFLVAKGPIAGGLAAGWLLLAVLVAAGGVRAATRGVNANRSNASLLAAHLFLPPGAVWLLLSRLGVVPPHFSHQTVFLAALHFHFSGFTFQILIAATGRLLPGSSRLGLLHRTLALAAIAGIPLIAAGNASSSPRLKLVGVALMVLSAIALAVTSTAVAVASRSRTARWLLLGSAASVAAGMVVAGVYGVGELTGRGSIGIPRMVEIHGLTNALGFTLCGLTGHLLVRSIRSRTS